MRDRDIESNIAWNTQRWGQHVGWREHDQYGYRWGRGVQQTVGSVAKLADDFLAPHLEGRYDLRVLEIAPGAGRFTAELIRRAREMCLVDLVPSALDVCRERFRYYPTPITYAVNDGQSLDVVPGGEWDLVASYDSMVHMHPDVIAGYVDSAADRLAVGGLLWFDTSGNGEREPGHRTDMTAERMVELAEKAGLDVLAQHFRNDWDCISVLRRP